MKDWIPGFFYGTNFGLVVTPGTILRTVLPLYGTGLGVDAAGNQVGSPDTDPESIVIHRNVGQLELNNISVENVTITVAVRFTVGLFSQVTGAVEVYTEDLESAVDANESFTHERRIRLAPGFNTLDEVLDPAWSMFDLTSKRALRSAEFYCMVINASATGGGGASGALLLRHFFRAWATWKG